jgi:signal transduction histidine kinase
VPLSDTAIDNIRTGVIAMDHGGLVAVYKTAAEEMLGVPGERVLWRSVASPATRDEPMKSVATALAEARESKRSRSRMHLEVQTEAGPRTLGYSLTVLGDYAAVAMLFTDLTDTLGRERRAAEERRFADVGKIASAMTHELKSPLATIGLYVELLRRQVAAVGVDKENVEVIATEVRECQERHSAILHSMTGGAVSSEGVAFTAIDAAVSEIVAEYRRRQPLADVRLNIVVKGLRAPLAGVDVSSIVGNLIGNAIDAMGGAGVVDVSVETADADVIVRVADHGPGLPEGDFFAPFYSTKEKGSGLGLWLARRLAMQVGGDVLAGDRPGGGAMFSVRLPVADRARLAGRRLLVVDDDEKMLAVVTAALRDLGADVQTSVRAEDVPERVKGVAFDCAVIEYHLPGADGIQAAATLPPETAILLITADRSVAAGLSRLDKERAWFLAKPFAMDDLLDVVSLMVRPA